MKVTPFLKRIATSPMRSRNKAATLKAVSERKQYNNGVVNIHRIDTKNAGDYYCAPHHYFEELKDTALDIFDYKSHNKEVSDNWIKRTSENKLIIGGGGLLNRGSFEKQMKLYETLSRKGKKTVLWGLGHNSKNPAQFGKSLAYNIDLKNFGLVGTRDYSASQDWVPCVSCLNQVFDNKYITTQETGIIFHKKTMKKKGVTSKFQDLPSTSNTTDLEALIQFIGRSETIITDSYHAMYWAILLEKKVVAIPNSSKFFDFKYNPVFSSFENCLEDTKKATKYTGVLEECREINYTFAKKVFNYLEI